MNALVICLSITLIILTWLVNCILLGGALQTAGNGKNVPVVYFFIGSQAIAALLHVTLNLPPSVVNMLFGNSQVHSYVHIFCLYSIYLDTLFCNLAFLQTFFSSLDTYLRLKNPIFYLSSSRRRPALWLKIGSPWLLACLQAIGQLALSDRRQVRLYLGSSVSSYNSMPNQYYSILNTHSIEKSTDFGLNTACLLPDPNFLIIRTVIAYALPLITCLILVVLQLYGLRRLRHHSSEMLTALLNVRCTRNDNNIIKYHQSILNHLNVRSTDIIWRERNTGQLNRILPTFGRNMSNRIVIQNPPHRRLSTMTQSYHLDPAYTNETLLSDSITSINRIQSSLSPIILSTNYLPIDHTKNLQTTTRSISMLECPTHGRIQMTHSMNPISITCIPENNDQNEDSKLLNSEFVEKTEKESTSSSLTTNTIPIDSTTTSNESTTPDTILISLNGTEIKLLPLNYQYQSIDSNASNSHYYQPTIVTIQSPSSLTTSQQQTIDQHNLTSISSNVNIRKSKKLLKSKSDYQIKSINDRNSLPYQGEQLVVAINLVSCIIAIGTWSPYILATLTYGLCQPINISKLLHHPAMNSYSSSSSIMLTNYLLSSMNSLSSNEMNRNNNLSNYSINKCWIHLSIERLADFRWWAYACSGLLLPCLLFFLDLGLREGCWQALQYKIKSNQNIHLMKSFSDNNQQQSNIINDQYVNTGKYINNLHRKPLISYDNNIEYSLNTESINKLLKHQEIEMISSVLHTKTST
ncbi:5-hydroxytryptamine receptor 2C [Schistosoma japonicum]|uniref:5-hydroxytryptamine receptor 2C n=1 Tax=Schistosoma japonicum TaxID=6182 RepID=A0A4Z2D7S7_SCHJA|nr:5-hydroxytryptamine receptor 2C [Schistosoma japonicum]